jgi:hypothetical protein
MLIEIESASQFSLEPEWDHETLSLLAFIDRFSDPNGKISLFDYLATLTCAAHRAKVEFLQGNIKKFMKDFVAIEARGAEFDHREAMDKRKTGPRRKRMDMSLEESCDLAWKCYKYLHTSADPLRELLKNFHANHVLGNIVDSFNHADKLLELTDETEKIELVKKAYGELPRAPYLFLKAVLGHLFRYIFLFISNSLSFMDKRDMIRPLANVFLYEIFDKHIPAKFKARKEEPSEVPIDSMYKQLRIYHDQKEFLSVLLLERFVMAKEAELIVFSMNHLKSIFVSSG